MDFAADIDAEEWEGVAAVLEHLGGLGGLEAVSLRLDVSGSCRRWGVIAPWTEVWIDGDLQLGPAPAERLSLPATLVRRAVQLAGPTGSCSLEVADGWATVANELGSGHVPIGAVSTPTGPIPEWVVADRPTGAPLPGAAAAAIAVDALAEALGAVVRDGRRGDGARWTPPDTWLVVDAGGVEVRRNGGSGGGACGRARVPAATAGRAAVRVPVAEVTAVFEALMMEGDVHLVIDGPTGVLDVHGPFWRARWAIAPADVLEPESPGAEADVAWTPTSRSIVVDGRSVDVSLLVDRSGGVAGARLATVVGSDGGRSPRLRDEIDALNREGVGLLGVRFWSAAGDVWAALDLDARQAATVVPFAERLVRSTADLGPLLAMVEHDGSGTRERSLPPDA